MKQNAQRFQCYYKQMMHILDFVVFISNADLITLSELEADSDLAI